MNKRGILILALASFILIITTISFGDAESYLSDDSVNIRVTINAPTLIIEVAEDSINLGNITKGYETKAKPFNITNKGTMDVTIQPLVASNEIFSNLFVGNSQTTGYKRIGEYIGNISKGHKQDFWIKLDLTNYTGNINGNLSTDVTFLVMSDD